MDFDRWGLKMCWSWRHSEKQLIEGGVPDASYLMATGGISLPLPPHSLWPLGKVMAAPPALAKPHRNNTGCWGTGKLFIFDLSASLQLVKPRQRLQTTGWLIYWGVFKEDRASEPGRGIRYRTVIKIKWLRKHYWINKLLITKWNGAC